MTGRNARDPDQKPSLSSGHLYYTSVTSRTWAAARPGTDSRAYRHGPHVRADFCLSCPMESSKAAQAVRGKLATTSTGGLAMDRDLCRSVEAEIRRNKREPGSC